MFTFILFYICLRIGKLVLILILFTASRQQCVFG